MAVFFYLAGEPFSSDPSNLLVAAFACVVALHFAGAILPENPQKFGEMAYEIFLPFGIVAGFMILNYLGRPNSVLWLVERFAIHWQEIISFFIVYLLLDHFSPHLGRALSPIRKRLLGLGGSERHTTGIKGDAKTDASGSGTTSLNRSSSANLGHFQRYQSGPPS
jgi:hypothetical protein